MLRGERGGRLLGAAVLLAAAAPLIWHYLAAYPREIWQVDLEVYRDGAYSLVTGRPLYDWRTEAPQFLPFTYPPFAALAGLPLLLVPFRVAGWIWTFSQLGLLWFVVGRAFRPFLRRFGVRAGVVQGVVCGTCVWMLPIYSGIRFGQVNALIVALCLADVVRGPAHAPPRWWDRLPQGALVGAATAIKLIPAVFWVHWALARRWRVVVASVGTAVGVTVWTALVLPSASAAYWTDALLSPGRLGPNAGSSNQSLRGMLLRLAPGPTIGLVLWVVLALAVAVGGFALSVRLERLGEPVGVVAAVGLVSFLVSPVSWVHHLFWGVVVLGALLGDGRQRARQVVTAVGTAMLLAPLPWWGADLIASDALPRWVARTVQNGYLIFAVLALAGLWWLVARGAHQGVGTPRAASTASTASSAQTAPPIRRTVASLSRRSSARPSSAPAPEISSSEAQTPTKTDSGSA
jgi:alpha-1,2-mannosyltransferase